MPVFLWSLCLLLPSFSINNKLSKAIIVNDGHRVWAYVCLNVPQNSTELLICPWYNKEECLLSVFSKGPVLNVTIIMKKATQSVLNMKSKLKRNQLRFLLQIKFYGIVAHFFSHILFPLFQQALSLVCWGSVGGPVPLSPVSNCWSWRTSLNSTSTCPGPNALK